MSTLRVHLIIETVEHGDIYTACGRYGARLPGWQQFGSVTGKTRFMAITADQQPAPGYSAVPSIDCEACRKRAD